VGGVPVARRETAGFGSSQNCLILRFSPKLGQRHFLGAIVPVDSGTWKDDRSVPALLELGHGQGGFMHEKNLSSNRWIIDFYVEAFPTT
jgi:hypothetical protein